MHHFSKYIITEENTGHLENVTVSKERTVRYSCKIICILFYCFQRSKCAYVIIVMAILWLTEAIPIPVTALLPIFLFPMLQVADAKEISSSYITVIFHVPIRMIVSVQCISVPKEVDEVTKAWYLYPTFRSNMPKVMLL